MPRDLHGKAASPRAPLIVKVPTTLMLLYKGKWDGLTQPQQRFLEGANDCTPPNERAVRFGWSGIGAKGSSVRVAARLEKLGLVEFVQYGRLEDDENGDAERPIIVETEGDLDGVFHQGIGMAFAVLAMADAIRWNYLCCSCGVTHIGPNLEDDSMGHAMKCLCWTE